MKKILLSLVVTVAAVFSAHGASQAYPEKPIRLIIPYAAGGTTDILGRIVGQKLGQALGQTFIVENKPGANSMIGTGLVAKSEADGYTLLLGAASVVFNEFVYDKVPYDALKDLKPITAVATTPYFLFVNNALPVKTVQEFVALAKKTPGTIAIGSPGKGGVPELVGELFQKRTGTQLMSVPYKGTGPATNDLAAGLIQAMFVGLPATQAFVDSGRLRILATAEAERSPLLPHVPTIKELGFPGVETKNWFGILGPMNMPATVVDRISIEWEKIAKSEEVRKAFADLGAVPMALSPERMDALWRLDRERWKNVIQSSQKQ